MNPGDALALIFTLVLLYAVFQLVKAALR